MVFFLVYNSVLVNSSKIFLGERNSSSCHGETEQLGPSATADGGTVPAVSESAN